jgi:eukaryotic-like serine/threonine-protein kinase
MHRPKRQARARGDDAGPPGATPEAALASGTRLGPYEIQKRIGAGGMGEVYRARDPRLRRDVAIKVLHRWLAITPDHVDRLTKEARAAGGLNHPNIVAVFDVGAQGEIPYVVSELLDGESLRARLSRGRLPCRKALEYAIQLADALGAAHAQGICHRDVKPGNAFITADGRIKLLDFGLVKLNRPDGRRSEDSTAEQSRPGGVHGTPGYMSPEQLLGEEIDHRTDLFALGVVLYEMLTGVPAYRRGSTAETMRAVLNDDPADLLDRDARIPPAVAAAVRRCLERDREHRFQSARDLAFHLRQLHESLTGPVSAPARPGQRRRTALRLLAVLSVLAVLWLLWPRPKPPPTFDQLTYRRGRIGGARFAADGATVVYSEARDARPPDVWLLSRLDSPESLRLGYPQSDILAVHGNRLALSTARRFVVGERFTGTLSEAPIGGSPHDLAANVEDADWDPAGKQLVIARSAGPGATSTLEYPPGNVLYSSSDSIRWPRFAPDGRRIAFLEDSTGRGAGGRVAVVDLERKAMALTDGWGSARGLAWSPGGKEVWFAAGAFRTNRALRAVALDRRERLIFQLPASLTLWDIAPDGRVLLSRDEERSAVVGVPPGETMERDLSWFDTSGLADLSRDGGQLLFDDRLGVYIRRTDGSPPVRLGLESGFGDAISPDGTRVLATTSGGQQLVILPAGLGEPVPLPNHGIGTHRGALWFPDGQRILFNGGPNLRSYVQGVDGGPPRPVTPDHVWTTSISPDGRWLATIRDDADVASAAPIRDRPPIALWPMDGGEPRPVLASRPGDRAVGWTPEGRSLWLFRRGEVPAEVSLLEIASGQRRVWRRLTPPDASGVYSINDFRVTPDGRAYFYSYKRVLSQLYVVKGLH